MLLRLDSRTKNVFLMSYYMENKIIKCSDFICKKNNILLFCLRFHFQINQILFETNKLLIFLKLLILFKVSFSIIKNQVLFEINKLSIANYIWKNVE